jgi:AraC family transcriptional regulator
MSSDYVKRINMVIDYINNHLEDKPDLDTLASVAAFSPYHFHRVFSAMVGESLGSYIQRLRMEKAAAELSKPSRRPITEIAMDLGFSTPAVFSRAFRDWFGTSPKNWRDGDWLEYRKKCTLQSNRYQSQDKYRKATKVSSGYDSHIKRQWRVTLKNETTKLDYTVEVKELPEKQLAYIRHTGPYAGDGELFGRLYGKLMQWAGPRDLFIPGKTEMLTIYHDSPEITEEEKLRISICMTVPEGTEASGEIGTMTIPAGRYAVATFSITMDQYGDAWNSLFGGWLPESGYQCAEGPCYELYLNDPESDPEGRHMIAIHLPVEAL